VASSITTLTTLPSTKKKSTLHPYPARQFIFTTAAASKPETPGRGSTVEREKLCGTVCGGWVPEASPLRWNGAGEEGGLQDTLEEAGARRRSCNDAHWGYEYVPEEYWGVRGVSGGGGGEYRGDRCRWMDGRIW
jgi:hypothetical protein